MNEKKWFGAMLIMVMGLLVITVAITVYVDPYFHYHAPDSKISYRLYEERYINDGIGRNFSYDAVITGTSMVQNFKTSEMKELFHVEAVKMPFSGAAYKEVSDNLHRTLQRNSDTEVVLWCLDYNGLMRQYDAAGYDGLPEYLYDDIIINDVSYWFNKTILYRGTMQNLLKTLGKEPSDTMDEYSAWKYETGLEHILLSYEPAAEVAEQRDGMNDWEIATLNETLEKNVLYVTRAFPDTTFYIYFPPYSIIYWDEEYRKGTILPQIEAEYLASKSLLEEDNIELYSFFENTDLICDLSYYNDKFHYSADINSQILRWISEGEYRITESNLDNHITNMRNFYTEYPYDKIFESIGKDKE